MQPALPADPPFLDGSLTRLVSLASLSFATLALCLILPGALLPLLLERFQMSMFAAGTLLALQPLGHLLAVGAAPRAIHRFGLRTTLRSSFGVAATGYLGFGLATTWAAGGLGMLISGLGIGCVEVAANTLVIQRGGERSNGLLNLTHLFFGIGSVIVPFAATRAVGAGASWTAVCSFTALWVFGVGLCWGLLPGNAAGKGAYGDGDAPLRWPLLRLLAATMALYVGAEMGIGSWLTKYMMNRHAVSLTTAGNVLSLYWLGLTAGRLVLSLAAHRIRDERLLLGLTALATLAALFAQWAPSAPLSALGFVLTGLGFSGIFPGLLALGGRAHPQSATRATSVIVAGAGLGQILLPWGMSGLADRLGLASGMLVYVALCGLMFVLALAVRRQSALPAPS